MISLHLQYQVGPFWLNEGDKPCEGGDDREDACSLGLYWLAEVYAGTYKTSHVGAYRIMLIDDDDGWTSYVTRDHVDMKGYDEQVREDSYGYAKELERALR